MNVCVYCASSAKINQVYFDAAEKLAHLFVDANIKVVYGGSSSGLMGKIADTIIARQGKIKGIMPNFMEKLEWAHKGVTDFEYTETMHERKAKLIEGVDAVVTLPGGSGTFEELFETMTLKRLGKFDKPMIILNTNGYYDDLKSLLDRCVSEQFMHEEHLKMWDFVNEPEEVIPAIKSASNWSEDAIRYAANRV